MCLCLLSFWCLYFFYFATETFNFFWRKWKQFSLLFEFYFISAGRRTMWVFFMFWRLSYDVDKSPNDRFTFISSSRIKKNILSCSQSLKNAGVCVYKIPLRHNQFTGKMKRKVDETRARKTISNTNLFLYHCLSYLKFKFFSCF